MTKKTFIWNFKENKLHNLKAINKEIYYKGYIRDFVEEEKRIKVIDDHSTISDIILKSKKKKIYKKFKFKKFNKKKLKALKAKKARKLKATALKTKKFKKIKPNSKIGASVKLNKHILRHKFWDKIRIKVPLVSTPKSSIIKTKNSLKNLLEYINTNDNLPITFVRPTKGGFIIRASNILGFLSKKEYKKAKEKYKLSSKKDNIEQELIKDNYRKKILPIKSKLRILNKTNNKLLSKFNGIKNYIINAYQNNSETSIIDQKIIDLSKNQVSKMKDILNSNKNQIVYLKQQLSNIKLNFFNLYSPNKNNLLPLEIKELKYTTPVKRHQFIKKRRFLRRRRIQFTKKSCLKRPTFRCKTK